MIPAIPHMVKLAPPRLGSRQHLEVLVALPVGHGRQVALPLVALVVLEHVVEPARHGALDQLVRFERLECRAERVRHALQLLAGLAAVLCLLGEDVVGVARLRLARIDLVADAVQAGIQQRRDREVRVGAGVDPAVLEAAAACHPHGAGAVLPAPVLVDGSPEAEVPHAAVGVDGRIADAHQSAEVIQHAAEEVTGGVRQLRRPALVVENVGAVLVDEGEVMVMAVRRDARERLRHERREEAVLAAHRGAYLAVGRDVVGGPNRAVEAEVEFELAGSVLVVAVGHVEAERLAVFDDVEEHRTELLELMDVVAVGLGHALGRRAVLRLLEPHHLGLDADQELVAELLLELSDDALQVLPRVGVEELSRLRVVAIAEHTRDTRVPWKLSERGEVRHGRELGLLGAEADVVAGAVDEEIGGGAVDELIALLRDLREEGGDNALPHDASRYRDLLEEDVLDALRLDLLGDRLDLLTPTGPIARLLERLRGHSGARTLEDGPNVSAKHQGGSRVDGDAVAHTSPPEVVGTNRAALGRAATITQD